jgi:hypothetical protein
VDPDVLDQFRKEARRRRVGHLESAFHMSLVAFQLPSACFAQTHRYLPFPVTRVPSGFRDDSS